MASIRYRVDRLLRAIQSALGSGVAAQVTAINADLLAEGVAWSLPTGLDASYVAIRSQGERTPLMRPASGVEIRITPLADSEQPRGVVKLAVAQVPIQITAYIHESAVTGADLADDGDLTQAAYALCDALWWCWQASTPEPYVAQVTRDREVLLIDFDEADEVATEAIARQTWTFTLKTLRRR